MDALRDLLRDRGYTRDVAVPARLLGEELTATRLASPRWDRSWRDDRARDSVHLVAREPPVAHLERFNPRHHPVLHVLVDVPLWHWRNRVRPWLSRRRP